jgi:hypothetical protein
MIIRIGVLICGDIFEELPGCQARAQGYGHWDLEYDQDQCDDHCSTAHSLVWGNDETGGTAIGLTEA